jgi:hypothetical protein
MSRCGRECRVKISTANGLNISVVILACMRNNELGRARRQIPCIRSECGGGGGELLPPLSLSLSSCDDDSGLSQSCATGVRFRASTRPMQFPTPGPRALTGGMLSILHAICARCSRLHNKNNLRSCYMPPAVSCPFGFLCRLRGKKVELRTCQN